MSGYNHFDDNAEQTMFPHVDSNYDDYDDFYSDVTADDIERLGDMISEDEGYGDSDDYDDTMDGDHDSAMTSAGWGTDEDYGYYGDDGREDFHSDDSVGFVDYSEDGPYYD